jgi:tRNA C32,U32 (ribose-2'-O)-methylase TrmJ
MEAAGFQKGEDGDPTAASVRNMLRRIQMNEREMRIMLALFNRVRISLNRTSSQKKSRAG